MNSGRPPDEAPPGHKTVSEVAAILGISTSAVRQQCQSGRLAFMADDNGEPIRTQGGARRYYIPDSEVEAELARRARLATGGDVERVQREVETRSTEIIESLFRELAERDEARGEQIERALERTERIERQLQDILEAVRSQRRPERPWWQRWFSAA